MIIRMENVRFRWRPSDRLVIDIPELAVAAGERVFIKGASGSGKTTLLNLISGVSIPEAGEISILDTDLAAMPAGRRDAFRGDHMGLIFQLFNLVPYLSLIDNVLLPCRFSRTRGRRALSQSTTLEGEALRLLTHMGLAEEAAAGKSAAELSVGQQQRVAAARSLIGAPELIIADEPTSSLDHDVRSSFLELLFEEVERRSATLLFVSHDAGLEPSFERTLALREINRAVDAEAS